MSLCSIRYSFLIIRLLQNGCLFMTSAAVGNLKAPAFLS